MCDCVRGIVCERTRGIVYECVRRVVYECVRGIVCDCVRRIVYDCVRGIVCDCVRRIVCDCVRRIVCECPRGVVFECQRRCDRVRLIYDVGALAPKIVTWCGASPSVLISRLHVVCVVETPRVLKQGVHKLHCWFTEPDVNLLLAYELFMLLSRKLVDLTRLHVGAVRSLWWFSWFVFEKSCCVVKLHRRRQFWGECKIFLARLITILRCSVGTHK